jgi:hypothetical protein
MTLPPLDAGSGAVRPPPSWTGAEGWLAPVGAARPTASWDAALGWLAPPRHATWGAADAWRPALDRVLAASADALRIALARWDDVLRDLGGDPAREDWSAFRPLRLSREEDWSDWLAHLLETARSGRFPARLFGRDPAAGARWRLASCVREVVAEDYRADLVLRFASGDWAHVEVKVGDLSLAKTPDTGAALRRAEGGTCRGDYLLLPEENLLHWEGASRAAPEACARVEVRTWHDVARALRESLADRGTESPTWRAWAWAFLGAVEQTCLGFPRVSPEGPRRPRVDDVRRLEYLGSVEVP